MKSKSRWIKESAKCIHVNVFIQWNTKDILKNCPLNVNGVPKTLRSQNQRPSPQNSFTRCHSLVACKYQE